VQISTPEKMAARKNGRWPWRRSNLRAEALRRIRRRATCVGCTDGSLVQKFRVLKREQRLRPSRCTLRFGVTTPVILSFLARRFGVTTPVIWSSSHLPTQPRLLQVLGTTAQADDGSYPARTRPGVVLRLQSRVSNSIERVCRCLFARTCGLGCP